MARQTISNNHEESNRIDSRLLAELIDDLYRRRSALLEGVAENRGMTTLTDQRGSEMEETAQIDRIARLRSQLSQRGQMMIREIEGALERVADGTYGMCRRCEEPIGPGRLRALPTAMLCIDCAKIVEKKRSMGGGSGDERLPVRYDDSAEPFEEEL